MSGGLRVPSTLGVGATEEEAIHNRWDTMSWVVEELQVKMGIIPPTEPQFVCPVITPGNLSSLSNEDYTSLYEQLLSWFGYVTEHLAKAKAMVLQSENEMKHIEVMTKKKMFDAAKGEKRPTAEALELAVETDLRYIELKLLSQRWRQLRDMLQGRLDTLEANLKAVSRHIEIRKLEQQGTRVGGNIQHRGQDRFR